MATADWKAIYNSAIGTMLGISVLVIGVAVLQCAFPYPPHRIILYPDTQQFQ